MSHRSADVPGAAQWHEASDAYGRGEWTVCLSALGELVDFYGPAPGWILLAARARLHLRQADPALAALRLGLIAQPRCGKLWEFAAVAWMQKGHFDMARACLHRIRALGLPADEAPTILQRLQGRPAGGPKAPLPWRQLLAAPAPLPTIAACLIVRDESALLARCLTSLQGVDELVVMDTGSTDDTVAIAAAHGARTGSFPWCDDFSAARNAALAMATADWILVIDADEVLVGGIDGVRHSIDQHAGGRQVLAPVITQTGDPTGAAPHAMGRVFARQPGRHFVGRIQEQLVDDGDRPLMRCNVDEWTLEHQR